MKLPLLLYGIGSYLGTASGEQANGNRSLNRSRWMPSKRSGQSVESIRRHPKLGAMWSAVPESDYGWLATSGSSMRFEIDRNVADQFKIKQDCGSLTRMFDQLDWLGLTVTQKFSIVCRIQLVAIRLLPKGKAYCLAMGWEPVDNDWERLLRLHSADSQAQHAGAVMAFAFGARQRGWKVQVLPPGESPRFYPDVLVEKGDRRHYVEVELGTGQTGEMATGAERTGLRGPVRPHTDPAGVDD